MHGPMIICGNCHGEVHPHCMQFFGNTPVCHVCVRGREEAMQYATDLQATVSYGRQAVGSTARQAQMWGTVLGAVGVGAVQGAIGLTRGLAA